MVVAFVNQTTENVVVHWIDINGAGHEIGVMVPNQTAEITTYPGHLTVFSNGSRRLATFRASTFSKPAYAIVGGGASALNPSAVSARLSIDSAEFSAVPHQVRNIIITRGENLIIELAANASAGFFWTEAPAISVPAILKQMKHEEASRPVVGVPVPGRGGSKGWTFQGQSPGTSTIEFSYEQPWPGGTKNARSLKVTVTVR